MKVRSATIADAAAIRQVALITWPEAYGAILSQEQLAYMLDRMYGLTALIEQMTGQGHHFLIVGDRDALSGFASFQHHADTPITTRLHKLYVLPGDQGSGTGSLLLKAVQAKALGAGDTALALNVNKYNPSMAFYRKHGFRVVRDEVIDIGRGFVMDDHVMLLDLAGPTTG